jgi:hypothetical protein
VADFDGGRRGVPGTRPVPVDPVRLTDPVLLLDPRLGPNVDRPPVLEVPPAVRDRIDRVIDIPVVTRLPPGRLAEPVSVDAAELTSLLRVAFTTPADPARGRTRTRVVWTVGEAEALVLLDAVRAELTDGAVGVAFPLATEQTGEVELPVAFVVGAADAEAGLLAATIERPLGPTPLVVPFGEAVIAAAWTALLEVAVALAARAGSDRRGEPLVPGALRASPEAFTVLPQARHAEPRR